MAQYVEGLSRTFSEYLLIPGLTTKNHVPENVSLKTPLARYKKGEESRLSLNIPLVSAIMQAVSDHNMAIELAKQGGLSFIYGSQSIASQAEMVRKVKYHKAGFVESDSNVKPDHTLADVMLLSERTGHNTIAVTDDGSPKGQLMGVITSRDYRPDHTPLGTKIADLMTPFSKLVTGKLGCTLSEANDLIWQHKLNSVPIIDEAGKLQYMVFRKDFENHKKNRQENIDPEKRLRTGAGINSRDYKERVPALMEAGADALCIDSSDGYSDWQKETVQWVKAQYGDKVVIGAGNIVSAEGFRYLAEAGADFIKIGIGGGSICITREQKGIGRGQASSIIEVVRERDKYFQETGEYIPLCSDGGITMDYHMTLALAMGADFLMLGRYFARFDESPSAKVWVDGQYMKEYWGEGSMRAQNWQRYDQSGSKKGITFEEGVDAYVPYAGKMSDNLAVTLKKISSTMCNCGSLDLNEFKTNTRLTVVSPTSIVEGGHHDVQIRSNSRADQR
jgi:IMP dehydrogenase